MIAQHQLAGKAGQCLDGPIKRTLADLVAPQVLVREVSWCLAKFSWAFFMRSVTLLPGPSLMGAGDLERGVMGPGRSKTSVSPRLCPAFCASSLAARRARSRWAPLRTTQSSAGLVRLCLLRPLVPLTQTPTSQAAQPWMQWLGIRRCQSLLFGAELVLGGLEIRLTGVGAVRFQILLEGQAPQITGKWAK